MFMRILFISCLVWLTACQTMPKAGLAEQLAHRNFLLVQVNQQTVEKVSFEQRLSFGERLFVSATACNEFSGFAQLKQNVLTVKLLQQTDKICTKQQLNEWDQLLLKMLTQGAVVQWQGQELILEQGENRLVYVLRDYVF